MSVKVIHMLSVVAAQVTMLWKPGCCCKLFYALSNYKLDILRVLVMLQLVNSSDGIQMM